MTRPITLILIAETVCSYYDVSMDDLVGSARTTYINSARQMFMHLACKLSERSLPEIASFIHRSCHTTVMHGAGRVVAGDGITRARATELEAIITGRPLRVAAGRNGLVTA